MKIILLKDVPKLGQKYDIKDVSDGHALNLLIPRGLAQRATPDMVNKIEELKTRDLAQKQIQNDLLLKSLEAIKGVTLNFKEKANEKGHLFAGVTREMIQVELKKQTKFNVEMESIKLDKPLKEIGEHKVVIEVLGKKSDFAVNISSIVE